MQFIRVYILAIVYMQIQFIINRKKLCAQYIGRESKEGNNNTGKISKFSFLLHEKDANFPPEIFE